MILLEKSYPPGDHILSDVPSFIIVVMIDDDVVCVGGVHVGCCDCEI